MILASGFGIDCARSEESTAIEIPIYRRHEMEHVPTVRVAWSASRVAAVECHGYDSGRRCNAFGYLSDALLWLVRPLRDSDLVDRADGPRGGDRRILDIDECIAPACRVVSARRAAIDIDNGLPPRRLSGQGKPETGIKKCTGNCVRSHRDASGSVRAIKQERGGTTARWQRPYTKTVKRYCSERVRKKRQENENLTGTLVDAGLAVWVDDQEASRSRSRPSYTTICSETDANTAPVETASTPHSRRTLTPTEIARGRSTTFPTWARPRCVSRNANPTARHSVNPSKRPAAHP